MSSGYDSNNQMLQRIIDEIIAQAKQELGLSDADIIPLPTYFSGSGTDFAPIWSSPSNAVYVNGTLVIGDTSTPAAVKSDIERKLSAVGVDVAWVNDSEYHGGGGNVHCGTNSKQTPVCADFTDCL